MKDALYRCVPRNKMLKNSPLTVVITGVSRGLGRAMTDEFIRLGHTVIGCARTKSEIERLSDMYPSHLFRTVDVASDAEVRAWAENCLKSYGTPDFVINNAAMLNSKVPLWEVGESEFSYQIDINVKGAASTVRHFVPAMIERRRGIVVNIVSRWGWKHEKLMTPYCATKWALVGMTKALAEELKPRGIAAVALNPGVVMTEMLQQYLETTPAFRDSSYLIPTEWARVAVPEILRLSLKDTGKICHIIESSVGQIRQSKKG